MGFIVSLIRLVGQLMILAILARALLSWFRPSYASRWYWDLVRVLDEVTEPVVAPIRRAMPDTGMFDFSPLIAILIIYILLAFITSLLH